MAKENKSGAESPRGTAAQAVAASNLFLNFTGLCGLVPGKPIDQGGNRMRVLLVDASGHEAHTPVLICTESSVIPAGSRPPDRTFFDPVDGKERFLYLLTNQDLWIDGAKSQSLDITHGGPVKDCPDPPGPGNRTRIEWAAPVATASSGSSKVRKACVIDPSGTSSVDGAVIARVLLTEGTLATESIARHPSTKEVKWDFKEDAGKPAAHTQALAEVVKLAYPMSGNQVVLKTKPFSGPGSEQDIRLQAASGEVTAWVKNIPLIDIFSIVPGRDVPQQNDHFFHFYDLLETVGTKRIPFLAGDCATSGGPHIANPQCPPALFADHPDIPV